MTRIKLVAVDMDGTLLNSRKQVPEDFEPWVMHHKDIKVVAASGRQYYTLMDIFPTAQDQLIYNAENGGVVFDHGKNIFHDAMKVEDVLACIDMAAEMNGVYPILCAVDSAYMCHGSDNVEKQGHMYYHHLNFLENLKDCPEMHQVVKVAMYIDQNRAEEVYQQVHLSDRVKPVVSGKDWIDVNNWTVNKGTGIQIIQKRYGISRDESMAFGDYMNDLAMLMACRESYAMGNACSEIKTAAAHETSSNDEDGVMKVLRML